MKVSFEILYKLIFMKDLSPGFMMKSWKISAETKLLKMKWKKLSRKQAKIDLKVVLSQFWKKKIGRWELLNKKEESVKIEFQKENKKNLQSKLNNEKKKNKKKWRNKNKEGIKVNDCCN